MLSPGWNWQGKHIHNDKGDGNNCGRDKAGRDNCGRNDRGAGPAGGDDSIGDQTDRIDCGRDEASEYPTGGDNCSSAVRSDSADEHDTDTVRSDPADQYDTDTVASDNADTNSIHADNSGCICCSHTGACIGNRIRSGGSRESGFGRGSQRAGTVIRFLPVRRRKESFCCVGCRDTGCCHICVL